MIKCKLLLPVGPGDSQFPLHALGPAAHRQQLLAAAAGLWIGIYAAFFLHILHILSRLGN